MSVKGGKMSKQWLKYKTEIYGLCAIWVMLFHISRRVGVPGNIPIVTPLIIQGNAAVDVFMLLSGICGYLSFKNKSWKEYYKKRCIRVVIPYIIISTPFWIWKSLIEVPVNGHFNIKMFIKDITTFSLWKNGTTTTWFVAAICLFYFLVPFLNKIIHKRTAVAAILLMVILLNIFGMCFVPIYYCSCLVWGRLPMFIVGYYIGKHLSDKENNNRVQNNWLIAISVTVVLISFVILQIGEIDYGFDDNRGVIYLLYELLAIPLTIVLTQISKLINKIKILERFVKSVGTVSLEIYMIHVFIIRWIAFYDGFAVLRHFSYPTIFVSAYLISLLASKIINYLILNIRGIKVWKKYLYRNR